MDKRIASIVLYECHTDFTAIWRPNKENIKEFGEWVLMEMKRIGEYCFDRNITPDIHILPMVLDQKAYDTMEIEELLYHSDDLPA